MKSTIIKKLAQLEEKAARSSEQRLHLALKNEDGSFTYYGKRYANVDELKKDNNISDWPPFFVLNVS